MKTALLASIAMSMWYIVFLGNPTRIDDAFVDLLHAYPEVTGDFVLAAGALIVVAPVLGLIKAVKGEKNAKSSGTDPE